MERAIVLIGVSQTQAHFDRQVAVEAALDLMETWAREQGMPEDRIVRITDGLNTPVTVGQITRWIRYFVEQDPVDRLIIYFRGHGCVIGRSAFWLLSDAPHDPNAAVNVEASLEAALSSRLKHVVFVSDACHAMPKTRRQARVRGASIFSNAVKQHDCCDVDVFFATPPGAPAWEMAGRAEPPSVCPAVYTEVLVDVLRGAKPEVALDGFIRPLPLKDALKTLVPAHARERGLPETFGAVPDARLYSGGDAWVARLDSRTSRGTPVGARPGALAQQSDTQPLSPLSAKALVSHVLRHPFDDASLELPPLHALGEQASELLEMATLAAGRQPPRALQACGLVVMGREVRRVVCRGYGGRIKRHAGAYRPAPGEPPVAYCAWEFPDIWGASLAVLELGDGSGLLVPLFAGCAAMLEWEGQGRVSLHYDPLDDRADSADMRELRWLRAVVEQAARHHVFELDKAAARTLDRRMERLQFMDPALALYAAYAYREIGEIGRIRALQHYLFQSLGVRLFDLALLSRDLLHGPVSAGDFAPPAPMLSAGWVLMDALGRALPAELRELRRFDTGELWTHYSPEGMRRLETLWEPKTGMARPAQEVGV